MSLVPLNVAASFVHWARLMSWNTSSTHSCLPAKQYVNVLGIVRNSTRFENVILSWLLIITDC